MSFGKRCCLFGYVALNASRLVFNRLDGGGHMLDEAGNIFLKRFKQFLIGPLANGAVDLRIDTGLKRRMS